MSIRSFGIKLRLMLKKAIIDIRHTHLKDFRNWFFYSLKKLPDIVHLKNLVLFTSVISVVILVLFVGRFDQLYQYTKVTKPSDGGNISLGFVGSIDQINPLFTSNDAEKAAVRVVFSGLTKIDENNNVIPDLAKSWKVDSSGKVYSFTLKDGIKWHDGSDFSADDVVFTIETIENQDTRTDLYPVWQGVKVEKVSNLEVRFTLPESYPDFPRVASQPLIAKHIYEKVEPKNIKIAEDNNNPVGTGPFKFIRFDQLGAQSEAVFNRNDNYASGKIYLDSFKIVSFGDQNGLLDGISRKQIDGALTIDPGDYGKLAEKSGVSLYERFIPEYEMMYLNLRNSTLQSLDLRKAIVQAIDHKSIMSQVVGTRGAVEWGPLVPGSNGYDSSQKQAGFDSAAASAAIEKLGWAKGKDGYFAKDGKELSFNLVCPDTYKDTKSAELISENLKKIGIRVNIKVADPNQITSNYLKPRNFDFLVVSQNISYSPDWYSLWDSSQVNAPGLNLSGLSDKALDKFVEQARKAADPKARADRLRQASGVIIAEAPAVYLYQMENVAVISDNIHGIDQNRLVSSLDYLNSINHWYINTVSE